jgi:hypothetical protein
VGAISARSCSRAAGVAASVSTTQPAASNAAAIAAGSALAGKVGIVGRAVVAVVEGMAFVPRWPWGRAMRRIVPHSGSALQFDG